MRGVRATANARWRRGGPRPGAGHAGPTLARSPTLAREPDGNLGAIPCSARDDVRPGDAMLVLIPEWPGAMPLGLREKHHVRALGLPGLGRWCAACKSLSTFVHGLVEMGCGRGSRASLLAVLDREPSSYLWVGHRRSKPRSVQRPQRATTRITVRYGRTRGAVNLGPKPSSCSRGRGDLAFTAGTFCRSARGLSSERVREAPGCAAPCVCSEACLGGASPGVWDAADSVVMPRRTCAVVDQRARHSGMHVARVGCASAAILARGGGDEVGVFA